MIWFIERFPRTAFALRILADVITLLILVGAVLSLGGCAVLDHEPVTVPVTVYETVEVKVPVRVPCIDRKDVPKLPDLPSREALKALPDYDLLITIERVRNDLAAYALKADAALAGCVK